LAVIYVNKQKIFILDYSYVATNRNPTNLK